MADQTYEATIGADASAFNAAALEAAQNAREFEVAVTNLQNKVQGGNVSYQRLINNLTGVSQQAQAAMRATNELAGSAAASAAVFEQAMEPGAAALAGSLSQSGAQITQLKLLMGQTGEAAVNLGTQWSFMGRRMSAAIDETLAGRWRQFDGTLASVLGHIAQMNSTLALTIGAAAAAAAGIGYTVYQWVELSKAVENTRGEMLVAQNLNPGSDAKINQWVKDLQVSTNLSNSEIGTLIERLGSLHGPASDFQNQILQLAIAQSQLFSGDVDQYTKKMVNDFSGGGAGALKWAESLGFLSQTQKDHIKELVDAHQETQAIQVVIELATQKWAAQGVEIGKNRANLKAYQEEAAAGALTGSMDFNVPTGPTRPQANQPQVDQATEEQVAIVDKYSAAITKRAVLEAELTDAEARLTSLQHDNAASADQLARAQEAVLNIQKQLQATHTTQEEEAHQRTLSDLQSELAADKDYASQRVTDLQKIYDEQVKFYGSDSNQARSANNQVQAAKRELEDTKLRMHLEELTSEQNANRDDLSKVLAIQDQKIAALAAAGKKETEQYQQAQAQRSTIARQEADKELQVKVQSLRDQIAANQGNFAVQLQLEDQILQMYKQHYGERSTQYQEESRKRTQIDRQEAAQHAEILTEEARTEQQVFAILEKVQLQAESFSAKKNRFSLINLFGGQDQTAEFQQQLQQITIAYEQAMGQMRQAQHEATNPEQLQRALDQQAIATAKYDSQVTLLQQRAAQATVLAWDRVFTGMEASMNRSVVGMLEGTETLQRGMLNIFNSILSTALNVPLQMLEAWVNAEIEKWLFTDSAEAAGRVAQGAADLATIHANAAVAASGAYAATAAIPFVGPELAPAAAAKALGETDAFAAMVAFDEGAWNIPNTMVGLLHEGEAVVPERFAEGMRSAIGGDFEGPDGGGGGGGGPTINMMPQISAIDGASVMKVLNQNMPAFARSLARYMQLNPSVRGS